MSVNSGHEDVDDGCGEFDERGSCPRYASSIQDIESDDSDDSTSSVARSSMVEKEEASCGVHESAPISNNEASCFCLLDA
jgi:hypothetical protein